MQTATATSFRSPARGRWGLALGGVLMVLLLAVLVWTISQREEPAAEPPAAAKLQQAGEEVAVVLDSAALRRAGIQTVTLRTETGGGAAARDSGGRSAVTRFTLGATLGLSGELVVDPGRITTIRSAVPGRLTALDGGWPALGEHVAAGAVVGQISDARPLVAPRGGVVTAVSAQPGELVQAGQELLRLADLSTLLARIAWRPDAPPPPTTLRIVPLSTAGGSVGAAGWPARLVGPAAEVDSLTRLPVYVYRLSGALAGARSGLPVTALVPERTTTTTAAPSETASRTAPEGALRTVLVPTGAVVQWQGLAWVFVQRAPGRFVRVRIDTSRPAPGGWFVAAAPAPTPDGLAVGDAVVVRGAQQLLSAEFRSQLPKEEEGE